MPSMFTDWTRGSRQTAINPTGLPGQPETPIEYVDLSIVLSAALARPPILPLASLKADSSASSRVENDEQDPAGQRHRFHLPPREDGGDEAVAL